MTELIHRRSLLRGLFAAPAVVAVSSLMPIRGIIMPIGWGGVIRTDEMEPLISALRASGMWEKLDKMWIFDGREDQLTDIVSGQKFR